MKKAIIIGGTGIIGTQLVELLLDDPGFEKVTVFGRRSMNIVDPKLEEHIINFAAPETWRDKVKGDVLFLCLGVSPKKAGNREDFFKIHYAYQFKFAEAASQNDVSECVLVSSTRNNNSPSIFYSTVKKSLEESISSLNFKKFIIAKPAKLYGIRKDRRPLEVAAIGLANLLNKIGLYHKERPIYARKVAQGMIEAINFYQTSTMLSSYNLHGLSKLYNRDQDGKVLSIRRATESDCWLISRLASVVFPDIYEGIVPNDQLDAMFDMLYSPQNILKQLRKDGYIYYIGYKGLTPCGYVCIEREGKDTFNIDKFYVLPCSQGYKASKFLFQESIKEIKKIQPRACIIKLHVNRYNKARYFYERMGMKLIKEENFCAGDGIYVNDCVMARQV